MLSDVVALVVGITSVRVSQYGIAVYGIQLCIDGLASLYGNVVSCVCTSILVVLKLHCFDTVVKLLYNPFYDKSSTDQTSGV